MAESFIILLREGIEVALVVGILVVYVRKLDQPALLQSAYLGIGLAVLASIIGAILFQKLALDNESLEGYFLFSAAAFVATMIIWMWRTAKGMRRQLEQRLDTITRKVSSWQVRVGILFFTFLMVLREGIETAIFLGAVTLRESSMQSFVGGLLGLLAAIAFGVLFVKGSVRIDVGRFLRVTAVVLLIFVTQLLVNATHEFYEMGILPPQPAIMGIIGPIVRNNLLFILAILSIPAFMFMIPSANRHKLSVDRKPAHKRWQLAAGLITLSIVFFLGFGDVFSTRSENGIEPAKQTHLDEGFVHIPLSEVDNGALHRFTLRQDTVEIRFLVMRTGLSSYTTAFDACRPCYNYGKFYVSGTNIICSQCEAAYPVSKLSRLYQHKELAGDNPAATNTGDDPGCFPMYLRSRVEGGQILISAEDLQSKREYFELKKEEP